MLMSAELKGCVTWFIYFFDLLWLRYNCAKFHHCRTYVWQILWKGSLLAPRLPNPWAAPKRPILNRVKGHKSNDPISSIYFYRSNCLQRSFLYLKIAKIHCCFLFCLFWSVKYINFGQKLPIRITYHTFLESRHPELTKTHIMLCHPRGAKKKGISSWTKSWSLILC